MSSSNVDSEDILFFRLVHANVTLIRHVRHTWVFGLFRHLVSELLGLCIAYIFK